MLRRKCDPVISRKCVDGRRSKSAVGSTPVGSRISAELKVPFISQGTARWIFSSPPYSPVSRHRIFRFIVPTIKQGNEQDNARDMTEFRPPQNHPGPLTPWGNGPPGKRLAAVAGPAGRSSGRAGLPRATLCANRPSCRGNRMHRQHHDATSQYEIDVRSAVVGRLVSHQVAEPTQDRTFALAGSAG